MTFNLPLSDNEVSRLYWELSQRGAFCNGEKISWKYKGYSEEELFTLAVSQSRFDPRLFAVLVDYFKRLPPLDPVRWKDSLRKADVLAVAAVIGGFVIASSASDTAKDFFCFLATGVCPVPTQLFYRGIYPIAGRKMEEVVERPLWAFKKWGFLATDPPILKDKPAFGRNYLFDPDVRLRLLKNLAREKSRFRLRDYLSEINFSISRQQALKDIGSLPGIRKRGKGKGTSYSLRLGMD